GEAPAVGVNHARAPVEHVEAIGHALRSGLDDAGDAALGVEGRGEDAAGVGHACAVAGRVEGVTDPRPGGVALRGQASRGVEDEGGADAARVELEDALPGGVVAHRHAPAQRVNAAHVAPGGVEEEGDAAVVGVGEPRAPAGGVVAHRDAVAQRVDYGDL